VLIGYMRILSNQFVAQWNNKVINVHPSLLPAFAGGIDLDVHRAVLASGIKETGCTVHKVTTEVDGGPIVVQKACPVMVNDTIKTLKARVQALEGKALVEAINAFSVNNSNFI
jgi:phosphoribosylglycinamide formyltransferase-1